MSILPSLIMQIFRNGVQKPLFPIITKTKLDIRKVFTDSFSAEHLYLVFYFKKAKFGYGIFGRVCVFYGEI
jgi:hypothetical protein